MHPLYQIETYFEASAWPASVFFSYTRSVFAKTQMIINFVYIFVSILTKRKTYDEMEESGRGRQTEKSFRCILFG